MASAGQYANHLIFYKPDSLPDAQPTVSKHWRLSVMLNIHKHNRFTTLFPGLLWWVGARRNLLDFYGASEDNRGRHTDHPAGRHSIRTDQRPTSNPSSSLLCQMPFLPQPSHFIPAWDRHQICWLAYSVARLSTVS